MTIGAPELPVKANHWRMDRYLHVLKPLYVNMTDSRPKRQKNVRDKYSAVYVNEETLSPTLAENTPVDPDITHYVWYHESLSRESAQKKLLARRVEGMFLVRKSSHEDFAFAMSLFHAGHVYNCKIRQEGDRFFLGEKRPHEPSFGSIQEMIAHFETNPIILHKDRSSTATLTRHLPQ